MSVDPARLRRQALRTRELLEDLETARPDVLNMGELNRVLRQLLSNQAVLLETLAGGEQATAAVSRPQIRVSPSGSNGTGSAPRPVEAEPECPEDDPILELEAELEDLPPAEAPPAPAPQAADLPPRAEGALGELRVVPSHVARRFVEAFDNRDKDYDKGLEKLNRWVQAGSAGTPFQWRGEKAYLNLRGAGASSVRNYEEQLMTRMGFSRRLGRLDLPGLDGEVVVYERPS